MKLYIYKGYKTPVVNSILVWMSQNILNLNKLNPHVSKNVLGGNDGGVGGV